MKITTTLIITTLLLLLVSSASLAAPTADMTVIEQWDSTYNYVDFTVGISPGTLSVAAFAVGSNDLIREAYINEDYTDLAGWTGTIGDYVNSNWSEYLGRRQYGALPSLGGQTIDLSFLSDADHSHAFIYYQTDTAGGVMLTDGLWSGFEGMVQTPGSAFVAFDARGNIIATGETSSVPLPGAVWLLSSGVIGLLVMRRHK